MSEILKRQKEHFSQDKEVHTGSSTEELEKYIDKLEKHLFKLRHRKIK